jgi:imidazolonepropionase-like amidohydrolase
MAQVLFEEAALFDGESVELKQPSFVLVEGDRIKEVSTHPIRTNAVERIDCRGRVLMPGMIDNHVHVYLESFKLGPPEPPITYRAQHAHRFLSHALSCGFTTVRDVAGGDHGLAMALRDGFLKGPRFFYGGLCLSQTGGHGDLRPMSQASTLHECGSVRNALAVMADGVDECIKAAREELRKGASHIKIMASGGVLSPTDPLERSQYSESEIRAIVEECTRRGAYVCAHCHPAESIRRCVEYGVRSIEHGTLIDKPTAELVARKGAFVVPTISALFALMEDASALGLEEASLVKLKAVYEHALRGLEVMDRAGVRLGFGTDLVGPHHTRRGSEFLLRREVMSSGQILRSATSINADILQMTDVLGVVKPGALADLLVVAGNPLDDIGLLAAGGQHLAYIMKGGEFLKRDSLA